MLRELVGKEGANVSNICFMLRLRIVRREPVIIVEKRATSRENTLKVLRAVRPLVGVEEVHLQEVTYKIHLDERMRDNHNEI